MNVLCDNLGVLHPDAYPAVVQGVPLDILGVAHMHTDLVGMEPFLLEVVLLGVPQGGTLEGDTPLGGILWVVAQQVLPQAALEV